MVQKLRCFTIIIMIANDLSFFHVGLSISDAPLGRTMLIRRGQLFREENLKRSGAIFEVMARAANTRDHRVVAADNFCHFKCRRVLFLIVISQPKSSFAEDIYR